MNKKKSPANQSEQKFYARALPEQKHHFFLFGPRGTGKSTWLKKNYPNEIYINLNRSKDFLPLAKNPDILHQWILGRPKANWLIIDEVQKLPSLLGEVQEIIEDIETHNELKIILTGSSARKLKGANANLLAGRARIKSLYPFTSKELNFDFSIDEILKFGLLPTIYQLDSESEKIDYLNSYVKTYLQEEIKQEAVVRKLEPFIRFLDVTAIMNGQIWNQSEISREVGVARSTLEGYLSILIDTLLLKKVEGFRPQVKVKEKVNPKYYYFDPGVVRALSGKLQMPLDSLEKGYLFETWLFHELSAYLDYSQIIGKINYWDVPQKAEVDFILTQGNQKIGFEVKYGNSWTKDFNKGLIALKEKGQISSMFGVYQGRRPLVSEGVHVWPVKDFLKKLWAGDYSSI